MNIDPKYTFVPLSEKNCEEIIDRKIGEYFKKWGLNFSIQQYLFNEPFHHCHKYQFAECFLKDDVVAKTLSVYQDHSWMPRGIAASSVEITHVPCSMLDMAFFDKLKNPDNSVVHDSGAICKRYDTDVDGIIVSDNLRGMLLDEESAEYNLYPEAEREEFIFRIFQTLVLGGELCQYEDEIQPYLGCTKNFYKNLIRVRRSLDSQDMTISTCVMKITAKDVNGVSYYPRDFNHIRNDAFLLIDGDRRSVKTLAHQASGYFA